jgi:MFS family permease
MTLSPGSRGFVVAMVTAQILTQIGAFTLPALLPEMMARWTLSATEAGWLIGVFFAAYVPAVPVLLSLTDRVPARRIYLIGTGATALAHLGFAFFADGFWSGLFFRALAGIGWAGAYMPGLKSIADPLTGVAQSRAVAWHAAGVWGLRAPLPSPWPGFVMRWWARVLPFWWRGWRRVLPSPLPC